MSASIAIIKLGGKYSYRIGKTLADLNNSLAINEELHKSNYRLIKIYDQVDYYGIKIIESALKELRSEGIDSKKILADLEEILSRETILG